MMSLGRGPENPFLERISVSRLLSFPTRLGRLPLTPISENFKVVRVSRFQIAAGMVLLGSVRFGRSNTRSVSNAVIPSNRSEESEPFNAASPSSSSLRRTNEASVSGIVPVKCGSSEIFKEVILTMAEKSKGREPENKLSLR